MLKMQGGGCCYHSIWSGSRGTVVLFFNYDYRLLCREMLERKGRKNKARQRKHFKCVSSGLVPVSSTQFWCYTGPSKRALVLSYVGLEPSSNKMPFFFLSQPNVGLIIPVGQWLSCLFQRTRNLKIRERSLGEGAGMAGESRELFIGRKSGRT